MDKRARILELVKEGVLSVEEGLDLLESLSEKEQEDDQFNDFSKTTEESIEEKSQTDSEKIEEEINENELEAIVNEINQYSVEIDALNNEILAVKGELSTVEQKLQEKTSRQNEDYLEKKKRLEDKIVELNKEMDYISLVDGKDEHSQRERLNQELAHAIESLYRLENKLVSDEEISEFKKQVNSLTEKNAALSKEKNQKVKEMHSLKMKQWTTKAKQLSDTIDLPEEWRESTTKAIDKAGEIVEEGSQNVGEFLRRTINKTKDTLQDIDWNEIKVDLSPKEKESFDHDWLFENTTASILDFKNRNGNIEFKKSMNENIKISAKVDLHAKENKSLLETLEEKVTLKIDADNFTFHISDKNINADLLVYLPERTYDYLQIQSLNGNISFEEVMANDLYIKINKGNLLFNRLEASMLEVKMSKGDVTIKDTVLKDLLVNTVHGDLRMIGNIESMDLNTVYGDILLTLSGNNLMRLIARSVKGDVKVSLPVDLSFEIEAETILGNIKSRLSASDKSMEDKERGKFYRFFRMNDGKVCKVKLQTTKGNILLKDNYKKEEKGE